MEVVESFALPTLRAIQTLKEYFDFVEPKNFSSKTDGGFRLMFSIVFGDLDRARELLAEKHRAPFVQGMNEQSPGLADRLLEQGARVSADDRAALIRFLHAWEAYTVGKLRLGDVWEPSPFPIEMTAGEA